MSRFIIEWMQERDQTKSYSPREYYTQRLSRTTTRSPRRAERFDSREGADDFRRAASLDRYTRVVEIEPEAT